MMGTLPLQIILIGVTGVGKSTLANTIATGLSNVDPDERDRLTQIFAVCNGAESCTTATKREIVKHKSRELSIVDTPGFMDTSGSDTGIMQAFRAFLNNNQNASGVLLVLNATDCRITEVHQAMFRTVGEVFGKEVGRIFGVAFTHMSQNAKEKRKREVKGQSEKSMIASWTSALKSRDILCPANDKWFFLDAEFAHDDKDEVVFAQKERQRLLDWALSNPVVKTEMRLELEQKQQEYLHLARQTGDIKDAMLKLSKDIFARLKELVGVDKKWRRQQGKEYFEFQPNRGGNAIIGILSLGMEVQVDRFRLYFEATDGDGDNADDDLVDHFLTMTTELTLRQIEAIMNRKKVGLRDFRTSRLVKYGAMHRNNILNITLVLCGTGGFEALAKAAATAADSIRATKMGKPKEASWK
ncbi:GTPase IMAP family member 7 [Porphyridium purpureum]|uniref:GTPase IMAP family member 7 n=1 Tax=Porphyridium purpureum TaxID=35688 RepID=A0A5J4YJI4_PORPP|nr:GTPase IMAP family member 7 [Porphyridium purpureum]|eukprot:POR7411..scf255_21